MDRGDTTEGLKSKGKRAFLLSPAARLHSLWFELGKPLKENGIRFKFRETTRPSGEPGLTAGSRSSGRSGTFDSTFSGLPCVEDPKIYLFGRLTPSTYFTYCRLGAT
jgi:hypothetical protein